MKQPYSAFRKWLLACLLVLVGHFLVLKWVVPYYVVRVLERALGGTVSIEEVRASFPMTTTLTGVRLAENTDEAAFSIRKLVIRPYWISFFPTTLWLGTLEIEHPLVRLTRTEANTWRSPVAPRPLSANRPATRSAWRTRTSSVILTDGVFEFMDEKLAMPFHGLLDHIQLDMGPVLFPPRRVRRSILPWGSKPLVTSFAVRGKFAGYEGIAAPVYCSGWLEAASNNLQASCQLKPLALAVFEPYYQGPPQLRVYTAILQSTSQWEAKVNELIARFQLELTSLSEADLSVRGRTILDIKEFTEGQEPRLSGELTLRGLLDTPREWRGEFLPADAQGQALVERLLEYGVKAIKFPLLRVSLVPSGPETMTDIEAASREVQEALELLAAPIEEAIPDVGPDSFTGGVLEEAFAPSPEPTEPVRAETQAPSEPAPDEPSAQEPSPSVPEEPSAQPDS